MVMVAVFLEPSVALAVIFTVPFLPLTAVTLPLELTVAIFVLLDVQVSLVFAFPVLSGNLAFNVVLLPALMVVVPESLMLFTEPFMQVRVTFPYFLLPSLAVAVIVTVLPPAFFLKVTRPLESTVAYLVLLDFHVTALLVALEGVTVAFSCTFLPAATLREGVAETATFVTFTTAFLTVTVHVASTLPPLQ